MIHMYIYISRERERGGVVGIVASNPVISKKTDGGHIFLTLIAVSLIVSNLTAFKEDLLEQVIYRAHPLA